MTYELYAMSYELTYRSLSESIHDIVEHLSPHGEIKKICQFLRMKSHKGGIRDNTL